MKKIIITVALLFSMLQSSFYQEDINTLKQMIHQVSASNGWIDRTIHERFWTFIRKKVGNEKALALANTLKKTLLSTQELQKENYKSALLSFDNKKVTKTKRLTILENSMLSNFEKTLPYPKGSKESKVALDAFIKENKSNERSSKSFFNAAANHSVWHKSGGSVKVTREMFVRTLNGIDASYIRVNQLFDPVWKK